MRRDTLAVASLLANVVLLGLLGYQGYHREGPSGSRLPPEPAPQPAPTLPAARGVPVLRRSAKTPAVPSPSSRVDWSQIESSDYKIYMANLRRIGCPEQTIRDIIAADVNSLYERRAAGLHAAARGAFSFWATEDTTRPPPGGSAELAEQLAQTERERREVLTQLLGSAAVKDPASPNEQQIERERRLAFLPSAKRNELRALDAQYSGIDEQIQAIANVGSSVTDPQELQRLLDGYAKKKVALSQLLSPEEYEQYELSVSWTADNLRRRLAEFAPTQDEFRGIFQLWRAHDEALATIYATHQPEPGNVHVFEGIRQLLGEDRYAQYRQAWHGSPVPASGEPGPSEGPSPDPKP